MERFHVEVIKYNSELTYFGGSRMLYIYTVQNGDTLPDIAQRFGISLQQLTEANNIYSPYFVYAGQKLNIPNYNFYPQYFVAPAYSSVTSSYERAIQNQNGLNQQSIEMIIGKKGTIQDGVLKFTFPRYDVKVNVGAVSVEPELALTSWMAFNQVNGQSMVMGDLVLLESEIQPVISQLIANGLEVTALHNHLLGELPRIMYLHVSGMGNAIMLAQGIKNALSVTQTPLADRNISQPVPPEYWNTVENIMGKKGRTVGRVIQFSFPRTDVIQMNGIAIPPSMGVSQAINFQAEGQKAAATGDFALIADEVNPVIRTLKNMVLPLPPSTVICLPKRPDYSSCTFGLLIILKN
jgi:hypothetical protein